MMDTKIEIGQENISFEMESKQEDNAVTYDSVVFRKDTLQAKPNVETQPYKDSDTLNSPCHFDFSWRSEVSTGMVATAPSCCE